MGQRTEVAVDQVNHRTGEGEAVTVTDRIHHPEIHVGHMAEGSGFSRQSKEVARVGIGMEVAKFEQLLQAGDHAGADQGRRVEIAGLKGLTFLQLGAVDPLGGEHMFGGEEPLNAGHGHLALVGKEVGEPFGVVGLKPVVDLLEQGGAEFIDDVPESETEVQGQQRGRQHRQQPDDHQIPPQDPGQVGALHLHRNPVPIAELGLVDLPQAGGGHGEIGELLEQLVGRSPQFPLDRRQGNGVGEGRQVVLELGELVQPIAAHQVWPGGEGLAHLDEAGAQGSEGMENPAAQLLLHLGITAVALHHQHQPKAGQLPGHNQQPAHQQPGTQQ